MANDNIPFTYALKHRRKSTRARGEDATHSQYQIEVDKGKGTATPRRYEFRENLQPKFAQYTEEVMWQATRI